jgi:hypothetical protein
MESPVPLISPMSIIACGCQYGLHSHYLIAMKAYVDFGCKSGLGNPKKVKFGRLVWGGGGRYFDGAESSDTEGGNDSGASGASGRATGWVKGRKLAKLLACLPGRVPVPSRIAVIRVLGSYHCYVLGSRNQQSWSIDTLT